MDFYFQLTDKEQEQIIDEISKIMIECSEMNEGEGNVPEFEKRISTFWYSKKVEPTAKFFDTETYGEYWDDYFEVDRSGLNEYLIELSQDHYNEREEMACDDSKSEREFYNS